MLDVSQLKPVQSLAASLLLKKRRLLLCLPRQEGKTELGVRALHDITSRPFTSSGLFLAKSKTAGRKATREKFIRIFDPKQFEVNTDVVYLKKFPSSAIFMDSVDKDPDKIRGGTYSIIHWSEVAFSKVDHGITIIDIFDKVIQPTLRKTNGYVLLESTNNGKNGWFDLWENYKDFGFDRFKISLSDMANMGLIPREEYEAIKSTTQPEVFKQEYECEWVSFQGKMYPELSSLLLRPDMKPPEAWQLVCMGIDWGYHPSATCVLFAYVLDGIIHIFDEHYRTQEKAIETASSIKYKLARYDVMHMAAVGDHEEDRIDELNQRGIVCTKANKVDTFGNRMQIKEMLWKNQILINPVTCPNLCRDLDAAVWHKKKENEIDDSQCTWGHFDAEAALRYLVRAFAGAERPRPEFNPHVGGDDASALEWSKRRELMGGQDYDDL